MYAGEEVKDLLPEHVDPWWYGKANRNIFECVMMGSYYDQYRKYCETLTAMDRDIGRLLDTIDEVGLRDNTVVIYMGDNGMQWGTHDCHGIREPYEDSIKLPFIIRAPWITSESGVTYQPMALNIDIAPTLLDIVGVEIPQQIDGKSLIPLIKGFDLHFHEEFILEFWWYFPENTPSYKGIRTERYKYIEFERGRSPWLFDLWNDPGETVNLFDDPQTETILVDNEDQAIQ